MSKGEAEEDTADLLDEIYNFIDTMLLMKQFKVVNAICEEWDIDLAPMDATIGVLTVTWAAFPQLPARAGLLQRAKERFKQDGLFNGL